jgi:hypothetical protein
MSSRITGYNQFLSVVHNCFRGGQIEYESKTYSFSPRILKPYDLIKKRQGKDEFEKYLDSINSKFSEIAKSELYRKGRGWIKKGVEDKKIRTVEIDGELFILPRSITENSIGIDTSEDDEWKYIGLFIIPDYQTAYYYLENHLELPKTRNHEELRWGKLNQRFRQKVLDRFSECLKVCCEATLIIKTNIFYKAKSHYKERIK